MAGLTSGDRPLEATSGAIEGQQDRAPSRAALEDDQTRADREQTLADTDQTSADGDQSASDGDQAASDSDQAASDSDQAASDRDLEPGDDRVPHDITRELRDRSAEQRRQSATERVAAAAVRDAVAHARDLAALERDQAAAQRDSELAARDATWAGDGSAGRRQIVARAAAARRRAASYRAAAAEVRARAAADRAQAARDRDQAARDRAQAQADREVLLQHLAIAETDALTGTRTRAAGLADLQHEIDRARRSAGLLVVAYVDVVGLKAVNDEHGHRAGDELLRRVVRAIRGHLRSYDSIVRLGGDEFLCVMTGTTIGDAHVRFGAIQAALASDSEPCAIRVGFAALSPQDSADALIERADAQLPAGRRS